MVNKENERETKRTDDENFLKKKRKIKHNNGIKKVMKTSKGSTKGTAMSRRGQE